MTAADVTTGHPTNREEFLRSSPHILNSTEVGALLGMSPDVVLRLVRQNRSPVPPINLGVRWVRFRAHDLADLLYGPA